MRQLKYDESTRKTPSECISGKKKNVLIKWQSLFSIVRTESFIHIFPLVILVDGAVDVDYYQIVVENYLSMRLE